MNLQTPFQIASRRVAARAAIRQALRVRADRHYQAQKQGRRAAYTVRFGTLSRNRRHDTNVIPLTWMSRCFVSFRAGPRHPCHSWLGRPAEKPSISRWHATCMDS